MHPAQRITTAIAAIGIATCVTACCCMIPGSSAGPATKASPKEQADRGKLIDKLQAEGILGRVEAANGVCTVQVGPAFKGLTFEEKKTLANMLFAWAFEIPKHGGQPRLGDFVQFLDINTGKTYATYSPSLGLDVN